MLEKPLMASGELIPEMYSGTRGQVMHYWRGVTFQPKQRDHQYEKKCNIMKLIGAHAQGVLYFNESMRRLRGANKMSLLIVDDYDTHPLKEEYRTRWSIDYWLRKKFQPILEKVE